MDKLTAVFGEAKAFIEKKISELESEIASLKAGIGSLFEKKS